MEDRDDRSGTLLADRWEVVTRLARGGMGDVYRARDVRLDRPVAIKVLRSDLAQAESRFEAEAAILSRLQHPNIVVLFDIGDHDGSPFLVMELVEGVSLADLLTDGPLDRDEVQRMGASVASALAYAHGQGVVHRDIKPGNVLFDVGRSVKLADFGIARLADAAGLTATGVTLGTAGYVAPEQLVSDEEIGPATDVYSLGLVLLEAATGEREFDGPVVAAAHERLTRDPRIPAGLPQVLAEVIRDMTVRAPEDRPSAAQVAQRLAPGALPDGTATQVLPEEERDLGGGEGGEPYAATEIIDGGLPHAGPVPVGGTAEGGPRRVPDLRRWLPHLVGALLVVVVVVLLLGRPATDGGDTDEPVWADDPDAELPAELDAAYEDLHRSVQP